MILSWSSHFSISVRFHQGKRLIDFLCTKSLRNIYASLSHQLTVKMDLLVPQMSDPQAPLSPSSVSGTTQVSTSPTTSDCLRCKSLDSDPKKDFNRPLHGWPELAKTIKQYPDFESFPTFRDLNIKSLLYYQCQLSKMRAELHELEWDDHRDSQCSEVRDFNSRADFLITSATYPEEDVAREQIDLIERIRVVLEKYSM